MRFFYRLTITFVRTLMHFLWNLKITGMKEIRFKKGCIICANHQSALDPAFLGSILPFECYFMAKSELFKNKTFGALIGYFNAFPVRRAGFTRGVIQKFIQLLRDKKNIIMFPEGSRKSFSAKPGIAKIAWETDAPIYTVQIENADDLWACFFRKKHLHFIFKKPLFAKEYKSMFKEGEYRELATFILNRINGIENED
ncbi:MAG: 1-acyl-sn-glycerol-3-phosphate acyltransferase [Candidatus Cloacimonetes bacterium]|nr:1-acyl-sn-glycerol-3-phosphate acyltransferase [Candidatus Cloacimonadota bacterium]